MVVRGWSAGWTQLRVVRGGADDLVELVVEGICGSGQSNYVGQYGCKAVICWSGDSGVGALAASGVRACCFFRKGWIGSCVCP